jgi:acyl-CoA synthetase (AMP-forming)/AMP-acid ligase II
MEQEALPDWGTIGRMLGDNAARYAELVAVIDGDVQLTYAALHRESRALAKALIASGVSRGDLVACWAPNGWRGVVLAHAVWLAGAVILPISSRLKVFEAGPILERTGAGILFTVAECAGIRFIDGLRDAYGAPADDAPYGGLPALKHLVRLDLEPSPDTPSRDLAVGTNPTGIAFYDFIGRGQTISDARLDDAIAAVQPDAICEVIFTSGTTGAPKGVQLSHEQLIRSYWDWSGIGGLEAGDNYLVITPFSHGFGLNAGIIASALRGMCMVLLDIFEPARVMELIRRHQVNVLGGPPNLFTRLMDQPGVAENPPKSLRVAFLGAASVPVEILRRVGTVLGIERVINAYGLMEACVVSMTRADDPDDVISTTTGRPLPGVELKIVDDSGNILPEGQPGEILVRGYGIMPGYWRDAAQTAASMTADGWFHTGDIGVQDAAGNVRIVDRKKDMFICAGFNAYPAEIEDLLLKMGELSAVSVVGVPDAERGEVAVAFVVPAPGSHVNADSVAAWAKRNLAGYKTPRRVYVRSSLPLNANGKVMKDELRREAANTFSS